MNRRRLVQPFAALLMLTSLAGAQPTAAQKATAETLFQRGIELADTGRLAEACTQFDASLQIDPALGTLFRLADCYDRIGRTASSWALFSEAQARARANDQGTRERIATERVANLELRLSKLSLSVGENAQLPGIELRMNDVLVPRASWGLELPVDPGLQRLRLSAPGRRTWTGTVTIEKGPSTRQLTIPTLVAVAPTTTPATPPVASSAPLIPVRQAPPIADSGTYPAWLGYTIAGLGLVGVGVAGVMGYRAYDFNQQSLDECSRADANACTERGDDLRDDARKSGVISTAIGIGGGALLAGGITLVLLRPSKHDGRSLAVSAAANQAQAHARLAGSF